MEIGVRCDGGIVDCCIVLLVNTLAINHILGHYGKLTIPKHSLQTILSDIDNRNL
jgi:hypothetical protein